ncbi:MAG: hypothetical protein MI807_09640 [Verrucomicrobiales bacterium]|nr:hypothetical protein [Verrucomicrobiales bacterium]
MVKSKLIKPSQAKSALPFSSKEGRDLDEATTQLLICASGILGMGRSKRDQKQLLSPM